MANVTFKGNPAHTSGELPGVGQVAPGVSLVSRTLEEVTLDAYQGKKKVLNIVPSLDTGVCATSTRKFNQMVGSRADAVVLVISKDLPFAQKRFCEAEGITNVVSLSAFRSNFDKDWGVQLLDTPLKGLLARSVVVLDENNKVIYSQLVPEITTEPDYDKALAALG
ncbi:MAG: thiol peroxidase [Deltaproteobacteria bacterium]|nr:thiol peroxidase [Deltaproteobacteria bacterium]